jgi:hypothetical protein
MAMAAALALAARTRGGAIALASVVAFSTNQPALPIVAAAASIVASWRTRRAHELLLPSGYLAASLAGFLGYPMTSALLSLAASAAAAAYLGRGLSTCPFRTDRTMYTIGLAAISALALASPCCRRPSRPRCRQARSTCWPRACSPRPSGIVRKAFNARRRRAPPWARTISRSR